MLKLNDDNLIVGEIKQLLKNFNLPNCYIGDGSNVPSNQLFINPNGYHIIRKNSLNNKDQYTVVSDYVFNNFYLNFTSNLKIENIIYDRYTHRYLGRYLRFIRDYNNIDLMCMYNCFDWESYNRIISPTITISKTKEGDIKLNPVFGEINTNFVTYVIPLDKLSKRKFSLYLQTTLPVETCLIVKNNATRSPIQANAWDYHGDEYIEGTYKKFSVSKNYLLDYSNADINEYLENNLTIALLIKIPRNISSSVVLLEGDYLSDQIIVNGDKSATNVYAYGYNINPQLTSYSNDSNYLISDKLIQFLTLNAITPLSESYDIKKVQNYIYKNYSNSEKYIYYKQLYKDIFGEWSEVDSDVIKQILYDKVLSTYKPREGKQLKEIYDRVPYVDILLERFIHDSIDSYEEKLVYEGEAY